MGLSKKRGCNKRTWWPHKSTSSNNQKKWLQWHRERRKDKGDGGGSIILKVLFLCEELCVRKLCVCERVVCEKLWVKELCVKYCLWQSCVWKIVCVTKLCVKDCVWQSCVKELCVTKLCVSDKVVCDKDVCEREVACKRDVCERLCVWQSCGWQSCVWERCVKKLCTKELCVTKIVCDKIVCVWQTCGWQKCGWQRCVCVWQSCGWQSLCERDVCDKVVCERVVFDKVVRDKAAFEREMWKIVRDKVVCVCDKVVFERNGLVCSVDVTKCHACHAKRRSMSPSATHATQNAHARSSSSRRFCVLRLPHESQPRAQHLLQKALCTAPATQKPAAAQRRPRAQQLLQKALFTARESHVWCELVCELGAVWWVGVRAMCGVRCERLRRSGAAAGGRKQRQVQSEKQEPHTVTWGKTVNSYKCAKLIRCYLLWDLWLLSIQLSNVASPRPIIPKNWPRNIWVVFGIASGLLT